MGYIYKVYEKNKNGYRIFIPKVFTEDIQNELVYFDYLACREGDMWLFYETIKKDNPSFEKANIKRVTIGLKESEKPFEYNPIFINPYIEKLFEVKDNVLVNIRTNKNSDKKIDKMSVITNTEVYEEMLNYILTNLRDKDLSEVFLRKIYKNKNSFKELLVKYSGTYLFSEDRNEDNEEIARLENSIREKLKEYKYFRTVATARYEYELKNSKNVDSESEKNKGLEEYIQEYDEYLSPEEYNEMTNDEETQVHIIRK